jgi:methyltransferase (TIGR00027 family)
MPFLKRSHKKEAKEAPAAADVENVDPDAPVPHHKGSRMKLMRRFGMNCRASNDMVRGGGRNAAPPTPRSPRAPCPSTPSPTPQVLIQRLTNAAAGRPGAFADPLSKAIMEARMPHRAFLYNKVAFVAVLGPRNAWRLYSFTVDLVAPGTCNYFDARARWLDGFMEGAVKGGAAQVLILAAGFDTRAHRIAPESDAAFYELDLPPVSAEKQAMVVRVVPATARRPKYVAADLREPAQALKLLQEQGYDPRRPSVATLEGVLMYLPPTAATACLRAVATLLQRGAHMAFDFLPASCVASGGKSVGGEWRDYKNVALWLADKGEPLRSGFPHEPAEHAAFAASLGFRVVDLVAPAEIETRFFPGVRHDRAAGRVWCAAYFAVWERV